MKVAIRYQSRGGHVREMAEIISEGTGIEALSVDDPKAKLSGDIDVLFIGGALYKFQLDPSLVSFIENIPEGSVKRVIVFGSSALTRRPIYLIQELMKKRGAQIQPMALFMRGKPKPYLREIVPDWANQQIEQIEKELTEGVDDRAPIVKMLEMREQQKAEKKAREEAAQKGEAAQDSAAE